MILNPSKKTGVFEWLLGGAVCGAGLKVIISRTLPSATSAHRRPDSVLFRSIRGKLQNAHDGPRLPYLLGEEFESIAVEEPLIAQLNTWDHQECHKREGHKGGSKR